MRIAIAGNSPAATVLTGQLSACGYVVDGKLPSYIVTVNDDPKATVISVDIADAIFGRVSAWQIGQLAPGGGVFLKVAGGNQNDKHLVITSPPVDESYHAIETGVMRALDLVTGKAGRPLSASAWAPQPAASGIAPQQTEVVANAVEVLKAHGAATIQPIVDGVAQLSTDMAEADASTRHALLERLDVLEKFLVESMAVNTKETEGMAIEARDGVARLVVSHAEATLHQMASDRETLERAVTACHVTVDAYANRRRWWQIRRWSE